MNTEELLKERGKTHGRFENNCYVYRIILDFVHKNYHLFKRDLDLGCFLNVGFKV